MMFIEQKQLVQAKLANSHHFASYPLTLIVISNQSHDHSVQVKEKQQQVESKLDKGLLLMLGQSSENLSSVQHVVFVQILVDIVGKQRQVQEEWEPITVHQEEYSEEGVYTGFWDEPWVQFVAQFDRVDVITLQIRVHDGEENLREQVYGINNDRKNK